VHCARAKFRELSPVLTYRGVSLKVLQGNVYRACIHSVLGYACETWAVKAQDMARMVRTERMMIRWRCGVSLKNRIASVELNCRLGIECITDIVRRGRLRCLGYVDGGAKE